MADWKVEVETEFERAKAARARGNEGQARVCARRAAGIASEEREELRRLRRENRQLRQERDILAKAAAWFAQSDAMSSRSTN